MALHTTGRVICRVAERSERVQADFNDCVSTLRLRVGRRIEVVILTMIMMLLMMMHILIDSERIGFVLVVSTGSPRDTRVQQG